MKNYNTISNMLDIAKALNNPTRLKIIYGLFEVGSYDVSSMVEILKIHQPSVSQHLLILRNANLVDFSYSGKNRNYSLTKNKQIQKLLRLFLDVCDEEA
jgi:ArsR family transcriptional regulator